MRHQPAQRHARGFTLVEILVVVVIIGIVSAGAVLSMSFLGADREITAEGERIAALFNYAEEQASLQTRELGLYCTRGSYRFLAWDVRRNQWLPITDDDALRARDLPDGLQLRLNVEGHDVVLPLSVPPAAARAAASASSPTAAGSSPTDPQSQLQPQVMIFSSGDLSSFRIQLARDGTDHTVQLEPDAQGRVSASEPKGAT